MTLSGKPLRPRSVAEEHLYIEAHPCACGERALTLEHKLELRGVEMISVQTGRCEGCKRERRFEFVVGEDLLPSAIAPFGGARPSQILDPGQFLAASDRWAGEVSSAEPERLSEPERLASHQRMVKAAAAIREVLKFIPAGSDEVPASAFASAEGAALRLARASQFRRERLTARLEVYRTAAARLKPPRALTVPALAGAPAQLLSAETLAAHARWLAAGGVGPGRLALARRVLRGATLSGQTLSSARIASCDLSEADLGGSKLDGLELGDCVADGAMLVAADLEGAELARSRFVEADLERARLVGGQVSDVELRRARLGESNLDGAIFVDCDLRHADLILGSAIETRFLRCDLRGANVHGRRMKDTLFEACRLEGVVGDPVADGKIRVVGADVAPAW